MNRATLKERNVSRNDEEEQDEDDEKDTELLCLMKVWFSDIA